MKKFIFQAVLLIIVIFLGIAIYSLQITNIPFIPQNPTKAEIIIGSSKLNVEIADSSEERSKGLGGRESIASDSGMLFIFPKQDKYPFWMKGVKFPLDFIWIRSDYVVDFLENIQPPAVNQPDQSLPVYAPKIPIDKLLEVNGGIIERLNIKIGDKVTIIK